MLFKSLPLDVHRCIMDQSIHDSVDKLNFSRALSLDITERLTITTLTSEFIIYKDTIYIYQQQQPPTVCAKRTINIKSLGTTLDDLKLDSLYNKHTITLDVAFLNTVPDVRDYEFYKLKTKKRLSTGRRQRIGPKTFRWNAMIAQQWFRTVDHFEFYQYDDNSEFAMYIKKCSVDTALVNKNALRLLIRNVYPVFRAQVCHKTITFTQYTLK
ncbi:hypothetical protein [Trichoplusia ni ascovirus 2c]|uniref:hypothetical protein n=1 Tax=Trichoplusia ni ascovirus 2c TaxID=328615 RepID=UPI0000E44215|nr:hypothetical protein TNAV2c_gp061 [Trichoplusia ni ascovirus 2c]ABF70578.1 hypothetical protein [Trichoplusia ni ascovirus 2c]AUS94165.1 hypothetical protein [Trichoplusia ni ascovirus 6b]